MTAVDQDLAGYLAGDTPDYTAEPGLPDGHDDVNRRLRRLARIRAEITQVQQEAADEMARIELWLHARLDVLEGRQAWELEGLEMWHRAVLAEDPDRKTISLPSGTLKARVQQPEWSFDEPVFLAWAEKARPELVRVPVPKPSIDKAAAKKTLIPDATGLDIVVSPDGELVPGVTVTVREPKFVVDTSGGAD